MTKKLLGDLSPEYEQYAQGIHQNSILIRDFITDILDDNQIMEGKFKIVNSLVNIEAIIDEAIKVNLVRFNQRKVKIEPDLDKNIPLLICDSRRMLQVMSNLISNSIKYSKDHTTTRITVNIINSNMEITVIDQGIGMKQEDIPTALTVYGTVHASSYHSLGSYGLGLPIVKILLDAQEATIDITSFEKKGTTVKITFPKFKLIYTNQKNKNK
jgi:two-component system cell cycle sensor histidine kinase PleC